MTMQIIRKQIRRGPMLLRELSWVQQRSLAVADNYGQGGTAGVGPVHKAVFQGFASGIAFSDDSQYMFGQTQEGGTGTIRVPLDGIPRVCLTGYLSANEVYNNLRALAQRNGVVVSSSSTGALVARAFDAFTMDTLPGWTEVDLGTPSHACETDGLWGYFTLDGNPGALRCVSVASPTSPPTQIRWECPDSWANGVYSMSLDPHKQRLAIASNDGICYLFDLTPLHSGARAYAPRLLSSWTGGHKIAVVPGADFLYTIGLSGIWDVATWDIADPAHPKRIGEASFTGENPGDGYGTMSLDAERALLYLSWPASQDLQNGGIDVVKIDTVSKAMGLQTVLPPYVHGASVLRPDYAALSPDGKWYGYGTSGAGAPGGFALYDVSAIRDGGEGRLASEIPANAETRGSIMNDADDEPHIYTAARYHFAVNDGEDVLRQVATPGYVTGNKVLPFGSTAKGVVPGVYLVPGQGFEDTVILAERGEVQVIQDLGNSRFWDAVYDGKHLVTLRKSGDYFNAEVTVHDVADDYSVGPEIDHLLLPADGPFSHGTLAADGTYGEPGAKIWVAADPLGVVVIDAARAGHMDTIARDPVYYPIATPLAAETDRGSPDNADMIFRFQAYYLDEYGSVLGVSGLSESLRTTVAHPGFRISLTGTPPPGAATVTIGGSYSWDGATWFGPSPCPEAVGLLPEVQTVEIVSSRAVWFGPVPQPGAMFPAAGSVLSIVVFPELDRAYVSQGDEGIRVYRRDEFARTAQLRGYTHDVAAGIAAPGMAASRGTWNGFTLASMHYTSLGSGNGIRFMDVATNPDDPPYQHIGLVAAGFTCTAVDSRQLVLANTVAGPVALTCHTDTWEPCPEPPDPCAERGRRMLRR